MTYAVQAADLCIYCVNWGFRLPSHGMNAERREDIAVRFGYWLNQLQYRAEIEKDGTSHQLFGVVFVPDPYEGR